MLCNSSEYLKLKTSDVELLVTNTYIVLHNKLTISIVRLYFLFFGTVAVARSLLKVLFRHLCIESLLHEQEIHYLESIALEMSVLCEEISYINDNMRII